MRVLLDTNVWRYLVDTKRQDLLYRVARQSKVNIVIVPAVVYETLRLGDPTKRNELIEVQTRDCWHRLMPDAYLQCEDVKGEILRLHPEWLLSQPEVTTYKQLKYNWIRKRNGFWHNVRQNTDEVAARHLATDIALLEQARITARETRSSALEGKGVMTRAKTLTNIDGSWRLSGREAQIIDGWRVYAQDVWATMLSEKSVFLEWLACTVNVQLLLFHERYALEFINFWGAEVTETTVPREWLRFAIFALQSERKVTDGNPTDAAMAVHLIDVDAVASADRNFVAMVNKIRDDAPFSTATGYLVQPGDAGMDSFFQLLSGRLNKAYQL